MPTGPLDRGRPRKHFALNWKIKIKYVASFALCVELHKFVCSQFYTKVGTLVDRLAAPCFYGAGFSADALQALGVLPRAPHIDVGAAANNGHQFVVERADRARGRADDQRIVRKRLSFGDDSTGADQTIFSDLGAIEYDRTHADQTVIADDTAVQDDVVADHTIAADDERKSRIGVQRGIILDLRALAELDPFVVAAQHRAEPDARLRLQPHAADQRGRVGDVILALAWKFRRLSVDFIDGHSRLH